MQIPGYSFGRAQDGAPVHHFSCGPFTGTFAVTPTGIMATVLRQTGQGAEASSAILPRELIAGVHRRAAALGLPELLTPGEGDQALWGHPAVLIMPASDGRPAVAVFTDRRWATQQAFDGLVLRADLAACLAVEEDLNEYVARQQA